MGKETTKNILKLYLSFYPKNYFLIILIQQNNT